jgi:acetylornithine deacetylase/succinyl-diaminopimelate desuccinylase-like protein
VVVLPMAGASVPLYLFAEVSSAPIICLPIVNHDNNQHAANENLRLRNLWDGIETYAFLMADLKW